MPKLFSYVVEHDHGFAPNPCDGLCTLAKCKFGSHGWKNIVELAEKHDWIAGTGGANLKKSAGHETLIYAMRVDKKIPLAEYCRRYPGRIDAEHEKDEDTRFALVSKHFFYFGRNAITIPRWFREIEKPGPAFKNKFADDFIERFVEWLEGKWDCGVHGAPCQPASEIRISLSCKSRSKQKGCK